MELLDVSLTEVLKSVIQRMDRIVQYLSGLPFQYSIVYIGQEFLFITKEHKHTISHVPYQRKHAGGYVDAVILNEFD